MDRSSLRLRLVVGTFGTVLIVGSGVATALVASSDEPTTIAAAETSTSTGDTVDTTTPSTPETTTGTTPKGDGTGDTGDGHTTGPVERYWGPECGDTAPTNHGQYVSSQPKDDESRSTAAQSDCGKPLTSVGDSDDSNDEGDDSGDAPSSPEAEHGNSANAPGHNK